MNKAEMEEMMKCMDQNLLQQMNRQMTLLLAEKFKNVQDQIDRINGGATKVEGDNKDISGDQKEEDEGGTAWIKKAMDSDGSNEGTNGPSTNGNTEEFSEEEMEEMEQLIVSLSGESDDAKRRERLAEILDRELVDDQSISEANKIDLEVPRFARLFQLALDNVGEKYWSLVIHLYSR